jgi:hypothetical protein
MPDESVYAARVEGYYKRKTEVPGGQPVPVPLCALCRDNLLQSELKCLCNDWAQTKFS